MLPKIKNILEELDPSQISAERKVVLKKLVEYISPLFKGGSHISLNFICTHNSRRSHLAQIWAQVAADHVGIQNVISYSGGTEATAMYPMIKSTLIEQGFEFSTLSEGDNPVYGIRYCKTSEPIIAFSKEYDHDFNPSDNYAAVMVCDHADENCPLVLGADRRIAITYVDPKISDGTTEQAETYNSTSLLIATEMLYVMQKAAQK